MNNGWQHLHEKSIDTIRSISKDIYALADAFALVGNDTLGNDLSIMATKLQAAADNAHRAQRGQLHELYNESQSSVNTMISALLNSVTSAGNKSD